MLKTSPLKGNFLFKRVLKQGKYVNNKNLSIYIKVNGKENNKLGICVSKKHGNSVVRNKLKRWTREAYKEIEDNLKTGYIIIVLYRKNIEIDELNFHIVKKEIVYNLEKLGVFIDE